MPMTAAPAVDLEAVASVAALLHAAALGRIGLDELRTEAARITAERPGVRVHLVHEHEQVGPVHTDALVRQGDGTTISVGVAANRLVAKIASDLRKPDGLVVVPAGTEREFLAPLPIERLWGVGASTRRGLADYDVRTIGDLAALPKDVLVRRFGRHGADLAARAQGIGDTVVGGHDAAKSVSQEHTFDTDTGDWEFLEQTLLALSEGVARRLRATHILAGTVAVKIRDTDFVTITRQKTLDEPTDSTDLIWRTAVSLTRREVKGKVLRLLGVAASGLTEESQLSLFGAGDDRRHKAQAAADEVRQRFGSRAIKRARLLDASVRAPFERDPRRLPIVERDRARRAAKDG